MRKIKNGYAYRIDEEGGFFENWAGKGHYEEVKILGKRKDSVGDIQYLVQFSDKEIVLTYKAFL